MDHLNVSRKGKSSSLGPDYLTPVISIMAVTSSLGLQFVRHIEPLIGSSDSAISGATILSVSLVFTGLMFLASHHYRIRLQEYQGAFEEAAAVADLIQRGERSAVLIRSYKGRRERLPS